ncbi:hypothetical protein SAMN05216480_10697 [Pustulibacterium marinum]|uniref:Uncharacterized protein n=1 Tax=Pustulibacterium marinum TaxID=1224947 RepID=A0A1I7GYF2_9FLAO|nr:hypothetical protein SAMN05216480_10697 [Pustulibacterium marinum]
MPSPLMNFTGTTASQNHPQETRITSNPSDNPLPNQPFQSHSTQPPRHPKLIVILNSFQDLTNQSTTSHENILHLYPHQQKQNHFIHRRNLQSQTPDRPTQQKTRGHIHNKIQPHRINLRRRIQRD